MLLWRTFSDLTPVRSTYLASSPAITPRPSSFRRRASSSSGAVALAHETAVALEVRRVIDQRRGQRIAQLAADGAQLAGDAAQLLGQAHARAFAGQQLGALPGGREPIAYGREIARRAAPEAEPRDRARNVRRRLAAQRARRCAALPDR